MSERAYLELMAQVLEHGDPRVDRTGVGTRSLFGAMLRFDLSQGRAPILTTKKVFWKKGTIGIGWSPIIRHSAKANPCDSPCLRVLAVTPFFR